MFIFISGNLAPLSILNDGLSEQKHLNSNTNGASASSEPSNPSSNFSRSKTEVVIDVDANTKKRKHKTSDSDSNNDDQNGLSMQEMSMSQSMEKMDEAQTENEIADRLLCKLTQPYRDLVSACKFDAEGESSHTKIVHYFSKH